MEQDPDAALECTPGSLHAIISGNIDGTPIDTRFNLLNVGIGGNGHQWGKHWTFTPLGQAIAMGAGARGDEVETSLLLVTPQGPPFDGAIFTASARYRIDPFEPAALTALHHVGWCPGSPIDGELTFQPYAPDCPVAAPQECALLEGRLDQRMVKDFGELVFHGGEADDAGLRRVMSALSNGGLVLVDGGSPESAAGVIAFPETSANKTVLCVEQLAEHPARDGTFHATALSLAGERPGEPVNGELSIRTCLP